jgi:hypothetical protein
MVVELAEQPGSQQIALTTEESETSGSEYIPTPVKRMKTNPSLETLSEEAPDREEIPTVNFFFFTEKTALDAFIATVSRE